MKKRIALGIAVILLVFSLSGCKGNPLEDYREAVVKTKGITKGQHLMELSINLDFLSQETTEELKDINVLFRSNGSYNHEKQQVIARNYASYDGIGLDFDYYKDGDQQYLKLPMVREYISLTGFFEDADIAKNEELPSFEIPLNEEMLTEIQESWFQLLSDENVFKGERTAVSTQEGEIKATRYYFQLSDEQIKALVGDIIEIFEENSLHFFQSMEKDFSEYLLQSLTVEKFLYEVYVDIDGYIVEENMHLQFKLQGEEAEMEIPLESFKFKMQEKNWNIEKDIGISIPEITVDNTTTLESLKNNAPFLFQQFIEGDQTTWN
ncbi:hypothetical protein SAMN05660297_03515 [Natronincola peptidivorans]|uniref:Lipoprotein n=1 Tax=Natronincola peptidivorans TaxID=426128 RepID=A0A1I0H8J1_9FIRM|nr:hypothetical protein [Natronincola peptidivorans]SET79138.1 hypothetical protein SAMN05660297_03515 [Natronincola peptidivorans]